MVKETNKSILIITPFFTPNTGGVETHLDDLCGCLDKNGYKVYVLTYFPLTNKAENIIKFEKIGNIEIRRYWWFGQGWFARLEKYPILVFLYITCGLFFRFFFYMLKKSKDIDVIHSQGLNSSFMGGILAILFKKRHITSLHTIYRFSERPLLARCVRVVLNLSDKILVLGKSGKADLENIGIPSRKIEIYDYWLRPDFFKSIDQRAARKILGFPEDKIIGLFVGRFVDSKLPLYLIDAIRKVNNPKLLLLFIGTGPNEKYIIPLSRAKNNVILKGRMPNEELPIYYSASDFLLWGPVDEDYLGRVSMEAISSGLPIVISSEADFFGIKRKVNTEIIEKDKGFLVKPDSAQMSKLYDYLADNKEILFQMRLACKEYGMRKFSVANAITIMDSYNERDEL